MYMMLDDGRITSGIAPVFVTLRVSVEEALRGSHAEFAATAQIADDVTIESHSGRAGRN